MLPSRGKLIVKFSLNKARKKVNVNSWDSD